MRELKKRRMVLFGNSTKGKTRGNRLSQEEEYTFNGPSGTMEGWGQVTELPKSLKIAQSPQ